MLDAARIRAEYRQKKRARLQEEDGGVDASTAPAKAKKRRRATAGSGVGDKATTTTTTIEIRPGESLKHFNRCAFACSLPTREEILPHTLFFFQESRGSHASAGAIRNACFRRDRAQRKEIDRYGAHGERDCTRIKGSQGGSGGYDDYAIYSNAAPRSAKGVYYDFERSTASSQRYRDCTASAEEAPTRSFFQLGRQAFCTDEGRGRAFDGSTRDDGDGTRERHSTVS